ncbi:hypothetical protein U8C31_27345 (plasmid) [Sinorhizobium medicae]|uniref:hypothetical protein n=1 Tax=Sinorhizobium medicae TaxID=110321 RepID=UPI002AF6CAEF|nr:hypothetical protein [Sinorhizobium medicae]WQO48463.1 hypothetical protein U8C42_26465 [Sinorhizobium medicae]WQO75912.1 hypothetical protein U8C31_27345 [Sinorhizobium medicae]
MLRWWRQRFRLIPTVVTCLCSAPSGDSYRHSAYVSRFSTIAYPWHPLFGKKVQVSPFRRGKSLTCIYTDERPDLCRELPNWMFDQSYCANMALGLPEISIAGLNELAAALASFDATRSRGAKSRPSRKKEKDDAKQATSKPRPTHSAVGAPKSSGSGRQERQRVGGSAGGSSAGSFGSEQNDEDGRR